MSIRLIGFPWDGSSSYARGPAHGPSVINTILHSDGSSPYSLSGVDIRTAIGDTVIADLTGDAANVRSSIRSKIEQTIEEGIKPLSLGGDHSISFPILQALRDKHGPLNILHIDAHTDLYDEFEGDPYSHACPFARAIEDRCVGQLVQVGLRSVTPPARAFGEKHGVMMLGPDEAEAIPFDQLLDPLYVTIDLDGLDPAFAPGVSHPEPGGLSSREVIGLINALQTAPVGADVVEYNPEKDNSMLTAHLAARLVKELVGAMRR